MQSWYGAALARLPKAMRDTLYAEPLELPSRDRRRRCCSWGSPREAAEGEVTNLEGEVTNLKQAKENSMILCMTIRRTT